MTVRTSSVWDTPRLKDLVAQPVGSPIDLTEEEAAEIVRLAAGRLPDLPAGRDFVLDVRKQGKGVKCTSASVARR